MQGSSVNSPGQECYYCWWYIVYKFVYLWTGYVWNTWKGPFTQFLNPQADLICLGSHWNTERVSGCNKVERSAALDSGTADTLSGQLCDPIVSFKSIHFLICHKPRIAGVNQCRGGARRKDSIWWVLEITPCLPLSHVLDPLPYKWCICDTESLPTLNQCLLSSLPLNNCHPSNWSNPDF